MQPKHLTLAAAALLLWGAGGTQAENGDQLPAWKELETTEEGTLAWEKAKELGIEKKTFQEEDLDDDGELTQYDYQFGIKNRGGSGDSG